MPDAVETPRDLSHPPARYEPPVDPHDLAHPPPADNREDREDA